MRLLGPLFVLALFVSEPAFASCESRQAPVREYLRRHPEQHIVTVSDLGSDDQLTWRQYHGKFCPGLATAKLDGTGEPSYALVVRKKEQDGAIKERFLLLRPGKAPDIIYDWSVGYGCVVWRAQPGNIQEWGSKRRLRIANESFVFERMESAAQTFFLRDGKVQMVQTSD